VDRNQVSPRNLGFYIFSSLKERVLKGKTLGFPFRRNFMKEEILIAGHGGQGVVLAGSLLANSAMAEGLETCGMVSYGVEVRGGTAYSTVIISDKTIGSPVVANPRTAIIMNQPSLERFEEALEENGLIILNTSECPQKVSRTDAEVIEVEATNIAEDLGNKKVANIIMVGIYLRNKNILKLETSLKMLKKVLPRASDELIELNQKALLKGYNIQ
jgi:2-oxoglutarate ferredoxin oxidoreductase subunit gamma